MDFATALHHSRGLVKQQPALAISRCCGASNTRLCTVNQIYRPESQLHHQTRSEQSTGLICDSRTAYDASAGSPFSTCPCHHDTIICAKPRRRADQVEACFLSHIVQRGPQRLIARYTASHNQCLHIWVAFFCPHRCSATPLGQMCDGNSLK